MLPVNLDNVKDKVRLIERRLDGLDLVGDVFYEVDFEVTKAHYQLSAIAIKLALLRREQGLEPVI